MPLNVVLFEPEIAPNTGNIIRLCANTGSCLHLVGQLGFTFDDKKLKRAGLDYKEWASIKFWDNLESYINQLTDEDRIFAFTTKAKKKNTMIIFLKIMTVFYSDQKLGACQINF